MENNAMLELATGDILLANAEALVNTVNCAGVMGRGVALQFKKAFPENFRYYKRACASHQVRLGEMLVFETEFVSGPRFIVNFPTKRHWRERSELGYIDAGLEALVRAVQDRGIRSIAIPPLGCGLGGLDWNDVRPRIIHAFSALPDVRVLLFEPHGAPAPADMVSVRQAPRMTPGRAVLLALMDRYLAAVLEPFVSLLEIHKLMYFMQEAGEPLSLKFEKGIYGPYATNLRHVLSLMDGHMIRGYGDAEDKPSRPIELLPGMADVAGETLSAHPDSKTRLENVARLIHGFETSFGMELLATVHWVAAREAAASVQDAVDRTYAWSDRKRNFRREQVALAWRVLSEHGWLATVPAE